MSCSTVKLARARVLAVHPAGRPAVSVTGRGVGLPRLALASCSKLLGKASCRSSPTEDSLKWEASSSPPPVTPSLKNFVASCLLTSAIFLGGDDAAHSAVEEPDMQEPATVLEQPTAAVMMTTASSNPPVDVVVDRAHILSMREVNQLTTSIREFAELSTSNGDNFEVRVLTQEAPLTKEESDDLKQAWQVTDNTVIVVADVRNPNLLRFLKGDAISRLTLQEAESGLWGARKRLPRQWWTELQSRYGNTYFVEENGRGPAVQSAVDAIAECLGKPSGCSAVPGVTETQLKGNQLVVAFSGLVIGVVTSKRIDPGTGLPIWIRMMPFWTPFFLYGFAPILNRTQSILSPELGTIALSFIATAVSSRLLLDNLVVNEPTTKED